MGLSLVQLEGAHDDIPKHAEVVRRKNGSMGGGGKGCGAPGIVSDADKRGVVRVGRQKRAGDGRADAGREGSSSLRRAKWSGGAALVERRLHGGHYAVPGFVGRAGLDVGWDARVGGRRREGRTG